MCLLYDYLYGEGLSRERRGRKMIVWIARNRQRTWLHGDLTMIYVSREVEIYIELKTK